MKKITKITLKKVIDDNSVLDDLGTFSNEPGEFAIKHNGGRNSYDYFNAANVESMKQAKQNYNRMMKYHTGELCDYGVIVEAEIQTSLDSIPNSWLINKIKSGGLWGISSDAGNSEFLYEQENQFVELESVLKELGFSTEEIHQAELIRE